MLKTPKTVIFDIGNVLMEFKWAPFAKKHFGDRAGTVSATIWAGGWWNELDRGVLTPDEVIKCAKLSAPEYADDIEFAFENVGECAKRRDYSIPWIKELKALGAQVLYLSNYSHFYINKRPDVLDFLPFMDGGVFSCDVHLVKPDPAIYRCIAEKYNLVPSDCLFIDDKRVNCALSRTVGFNAHDFVDYEAAYSATKEFLSL